MLSRVIKLLERDSSREYFLRNLSDTSVLLLPPLLLNVFSFLRDTKFIRIRLLMPHPYQRYSEQQREHINELQSDYSELARNRQHVEAVETIKKHIHELEAFINLGALLCNAATTLLLANLCETVFGSGILKLRVNKQCSAQW